MEDDTSVPDHKLCGFLCAVLTVTPPHHTPARLGTRFQIFRLDSEVGFRSESSDDVVLCPVDSEQQECEGLEAGVPNRKKKKKKSRSIGLVNGSISVVEQLYALVSNKCVKIVARLVWAEAEAKACGGLGRAVLLVDVYLPIELWSGWQFPKCGSVAGALFRHLRYHIICFLQFIN